MLRISETITYFGLEQSKIFSNYNLKIIIFTNARKY
jgi:hypothetical protein